ncbi:hypothetical protein [Oceanithermus sp.]
MTTIETTIINEEARLEFEVTVTMHDAEDAKEAAITIAAFERALIQARAEERAITVEELAKRLGVK